MDIDKSLRHLGECDISALRSDIDSLTAEDWLENTYRQQTFSVHTQTQSIMLLFSDGSGWPDIEVKREAGWNLLSKSAVPVMRAIVEKHYAPGGTIIRAMAAKLPPGGIIRGHSDRHPSFQFSHRIHIPITTNSRVRFTLDGRPQQLEVGRAYEINNQKPHSVMNKGEQARVNFIFDYVPPQHLGQMSC